MRFGTTLPVIFGAQKEDLLAWAARAEQSGFTSLTVFDRLVYPNFEPLVALAAAASVTQSIELVTGILVTPTREVSLLAKQIASLDILANGRLTIGIGVGNKIVDFQAAGIAYDERGKILDEQLERLHSIWSGQFVDEDGLVLGPLPVQAGGPQLLFGGTSPAVARRVGRWGNGHIASASIPGVLEKIHKNIETAWSENGRTGKPRYVVDINYAFGPGAFEKSAEMMREYYAFLGQDMANAITKAIITTPEKLKERIHLLEDLNIDEIILSPAVPGIDQLERVIDVIGDSLIH